MGLFFAIVAWVVGQWWSASVSIPIADWTLSANMSSVAGHACLQHRRSMLSATLRRYGEPPKYRVRMSQRTVEWARRMMADVKANRKKDEVLKGAGCVVWYGKSPAIQIRHWLIVTIFVLFNVVLMFIYRKKPPILSETVESHAKPIEAKVESND